MSLKIYLIEPEIPQNTGNIGRMAAATGSELILVGKLGFSLEEKQLRRAGMDYWKELNVKTITIDEFISCITPDICFISTKGIKKYDEMPATTDKIVFGNESSGLPAIIYDKYRDQLYRIPMREGIRSMNLATSAGIVTYELLRKYGFSGLT